MENQNSCTAYIRKAESSDWNQLLPLLHEMGKTDSEDGVRERFLRLLDMQEHYIPVAILADNIVGYAWAQDYGYHLRTGKKVVRMHDMFTDPEHRRSGIGKKLFTAIKVWSSRRNATWLQWNSSPKVVDFYKKMGLKSIEEDKDYPFFEVTFDQK